jgi:hypothetical protein
VRLAERAEHYRGTLVTEFVHPALVRFHILYHTVTGQGGPTFRHEFVVTPDGVLTTLHCNENIPFGLTVPVVLDDGRPLDVELTAPCISVSYPSEIEPAGDEQNFLLLDNGAEVSSDEPPIRSAVGWIKPLRATNRKRPIRVFVYPRSAGDPPAGEVQASFRVAEDGFTSCLGSVRGTLYQGRTSAGGRGQSLATGDGTAGLDFDAPCDFLVQRGAAGPAMVETDRRTTVKVNDRELALKGFTPLAVPGSTQYLRHSGDCCAGSCCDMLGCPTYAMLLSRYLIFLTGDMR